MRTNTPQKSLNCRPALAIYLVKNLQKQLQKLRLDMCLHKTQTHARNRDVTSGDVAWDFRRQVQCVSQETAVSAIIVLICSTEPNVCRSSSTQRMIVVTAARATRYVACPLKYCDPLGTLFTTISSLHCCLHILAYTFFGHMHVLWSLLWRNKTKKVYVFDFAN